MSSSKRLVSTDAVKPVDELAIAVAGILGGTTLEAVWNYMKSHFNARSIQFYLICSGLALTVLDSVSDAVVGSIPPGWHAAFPPIAKAGERMRPLNMTASRCAGAIFIQLMKQTPPLMTKAHVKKIVEKADSTGTNLIRSKAAGKSAEINKEWHAEHGDDVATTFSLLSGKMLNATTYKLTGAEEEK